MRITIISHDNWGYNNNIAVALKKKGHVVHHIDFSTFKYKYPNFGYKVFNFFLKVFFQRNLKNIHFGKEIVRRLQQLDEIQDAILTIKGDWIDPKQVLELKKHTKKSIAFFNDNIYRCPKILRVIQNFDEVYSFEKEDCEKHNLKFISNWIYSVEDQEIPNNSFDYDVFNISSKDNRFKTISKVADELKKQNITTKIIIFDKKNKNSNPNIEFISKYIQIADVKKLMTHSKILLDIQRKEQNGLTFRVFESISLHKKLITTNPNIVNYDFYSPNNILVIDEENIHFDADFFKIPYEPIPENIYNKYTLDNWINKVFNY
jgi:hypothetical protein